MNLVDAQQARRILDRLVGYNLSPFLWKKIVKGLSAGRVQSVALRIITEREREIEAFVPTEYWSIHAILNVTSQDDTQFEATLETIGDTKVEVETINTEKQANDIVKDLSSASYNISDVSSRETKKNPSPPFITSTLQQEAYKRLYFSSRQTMRVAQMLYEKGLITYMRTDSINLASSSTSAAAAWLNKNLGKEYTLNSPRVFKTKSKRAQEAHEAIRPTNPSNPPHSMGGASFSPQEDKLYELIWRRFMASQMPQALFANTTIIVDAEGEDTYTLKTTGSIQHFDGFLKLWPTAYQETPLPELSAKDTLSANTINPQQHFTKPPARYNDASLIKVLEEHGIGRPSTYAPTISVIQDRNYVIKNEDRRFEPTDIGIKVNDLLVKHFPSIVDIKFTAEMEDNLDKVAEGAGKWQELIKSFYVPFSKLLEEKYETVKKQTPPEEKTDQVCEKCGKQMVVKFSRFGKFLACSGFPECKNAKSLPGEHNNVARKTFGTCPECGKGNIIRRRTKKRRFFYGCSQYPDCEFTSWKKPQIKKPATE